MKLWFKLGWRNLWRNRRRTIIEIVSISGSVMLGVFWNNLAIGSYDKMINDGVKMGSGHIGIYHPDYLEMRKTEQVVDAGAIVPEIAKIGRVVHIFPRLHVPGLVRSARESRASMIMGIDFDREKAVNPLLADKRIVDGGLPDPEKREALIGDKLATELDIGVGKKLVVMAQGADGEIVSGLYRVSGLVHTNIQELDAGAVIVDRRKLGALTGYGDKAHEIAIMLSRHKMIGEVLPDIERIVSNHPPASAFRWEVAMKSLSDMVELDHAGLKIMVFILYVIVGIGTINTLLMSVMERTREFGVIRAIGVNRSGVRKMVLSEAAVLSFVGVLIGVGLGSLIGLYTHFHGIDLSGAIDEQGVGGTLFEPIMFSVWDWYSTAVLGIGMMIIAILASFYPTHYVLRIQPSEAMRRY